MAADPENGPLPSERTTRPGSAVNTLLKIQSQFEEWEQRDRWKRRRNLIMISLALLGAAAVIAVVTLLPGGGEPAPPPAGPAPAAKSVPAVPEPPPGTLRFVTALRPDPRLAAYTERWREQIEAAAANLVADAPAGVYGNLVLITFISADGNLARIEVSRSSGHIGLDDAAVRIVRAAAPFDPFPEAIRRDTGTLAIVRTFAFEPAAGPQPRSAVLGRDGRPKK